MTGTRPSFVLLGLVLLTASSCGSPEETSEAIDKTIDVATEDVRDLADETVHALDAAGGELGGHIEDAIEEVGKAIDNIGRKQSNAK